MQQVPAIAIITAKYIPPPNEAPLADAGPDEIVDAGTDVALDGSASSDPENDPLTYLWIQTSGPPVTLRDTETTSPSFLAPIDISSDIDLTFRLIVTDNQGETSNDDIQVTVQYIPPTTPDMTEDNMMSGINDNQTGEGGNATQKGPLEKLMEILGSEGNQSQ